MTTDPIDSAINAEHSRQERAWQEATSDPSSDVLERLRVATADPWRLHMPDGAMLLHCDIVEALATIERLSAERDELEREVARERCVSDAEHDNAERLSAERMQLREALEGAADELQSCADQFRALKMTTCAQYAEAQETKARAALSNTAENG